MSSLQKSLHTLRSIVKFAGMFASAAIAVLLAITALCPAVFADNDFCKGGILDAGAPLGTLGPDLVIGPGTSCTVDGKVWKTYDFHNVYDELPMGLYLDESVSGDELRDTNDELTGCVRFLASLSRVDGLILLDFRLRLKAFAYFLQSGNYSPRRSRPSLSSTEPSGHKDQETQSKS